MKAVLLMVITAGFTVSALACNRGRVSQHSTACCHHHSSWYEVCCRTGPREHRIEFQWHTVSGRRVLRYRRVTYHTVSGKWTYNPWQVEVNVSSSKAGRSCCSSTTRRVVTKHCNTRRANNCTRTTVTRVYNYSPPARESRSVHREPANPGSSRIQQVSGRVRVR